MLTQILYVTRSAMWKSQSLVQMIPIKVFRTKVRPYMTRSNNWRQARLNLSFWEAVKSRMILKSAFLIKGSRWMWSLRDKANFLIQTLGGLKWNICTSGVAANDPPLLTRAHLWTSHCQLTILISRSLTEVAANPESPSLPTSLCHRWSLNAIRSIWTHRNLISTIRPIAVLIMIQRAW